MIRTMMVVEEGEALEEERQSVGPIELGEAGDGTGSVGSGVAKKLATRTTPRPAMPIRGDETLLPSPANDS